MPNVPGKNVLLTIPLMCRASSSNVGVSFPKPELNLVVRNDETFEEYLRVFKQVQTILNDAGTNFNNFANTLFTALMNRGNTPIADVLKPQGELLWNRSVSLVQNTANPYLDDRPLYWARLQGIGAIRAYAKRNNLTLDSDLLNKFEWTSRGLDAMDGSIKFTGVPAGARKAIVTGFDPFGLNGGDNGSGNDFAEQSNPSGLIALFFNGGPIDAQLQGDIYVRTAIFPVRYQDFNGVNGIVEKAIMPSLGSIVMLITTSQNGGQNYYDVERWAARFRVNGTDNITKKVRATQRYRL